MQFENFMDFDFQAIIFYIQKTYQRKVLLINQIRSLWYRLHSVCPSHILHGLDYLSLSLSLCVSVCLHCFILIWYNKEEIMTIEVCLYGDIFNSWYIVACRSILFVKISTLFVSICYRIVVPSEDIQIRDTRSFVQGILMKISEALVKAKVLWTAQ